MAFLCVANLANAACQVPVPDGGRQSSPPNLVGKVVAIESGTIALRTKSGRLARVKPPKSHVYFTAFGGDESIDKLQPGLIARVWFVNCHAPVGRNLAEVAYFEVYSNDPLDRPPAEYLQVR